MRNKNLALVGFMGSGKTTVSKKLAQMLGRERVSTDDLIEAREKKTITDIFKNQGEPYFRDLERRIVEEVSGATGLIIDCGGGVVLDDRNMRALRSSGVIIYLRSSPEFIYECIKGQTHRPLLQVDDPLAKIRELLEKRKPFYEKADLIIEGDQKTISEICDEIVKMVADHLG